MKVHPVNVEGYNGSLEGLAQKVCRMRYDEVARFFGYCVVELMRQSHGDTQRGRRKLAGRLILARGIALALHQEMFRIFKLCEPHMKEELEANPPSIKKMMLR